MSKVKDTSNKVKSKIDAIKKINDNPKLTTDKIADKILKDLPSTNEMLGKKVDDFIDKRRSKKENRTDIFGQMVNLADSFTNKNGNTPSFNIGHNKTFTDNTTFSQKKIQKNAIYAANQVLNKSDKIISDNVSKIFFAGDGICGTDTAFKDDTIFIKPKEIDFLNILTINPDDGIGKIIYEPIDFVTPKVKFDRELYSLFTPGNSFTFNSINDNDLFGINWDVPNQRYVVTGLTNNESISEFLSDYYSSIIFPDINHIIKTSILLTLQGDGSETTLFNESLDKMERLLQKLMSVCGNPTKNDELKNQNAIDLFNETDEDIQYYFNFDDVEGIDLDNEDARARGVLKFKDCNNFEIPKNTTMIEDFIYFIDKKDMILLTDEILGRAAEDVYSQSNSTISLDNFRISFMNLFIFNIPKALISSLLTPKIIFPIVAVYKQYYNVDIDIYGLMKKLSKLFFFIIRDLFWLFIREFWKKTKPELTKFLSTLVSNIIKNKNKRYIIIIKALIALLSKILKDGIDNCADLYGVVMETINAALSIPMPFKIPGILLSLSSRLPGYSEDRAVLNIMERMENAGIPTGQLYGDPNKYVDLVSAIIKGNAEEIAGNSFATVANEFIVLQATPTGQVIIPPGTIKSNGIGQA